MGNKALLHIVISFRKGPSSSTVSPLVSCEMTVSRPIICEEGHLYAADEARGAPEPPRIPLATVHCSFISELFLDMFLETVSLRHPKQHHTPCCRLFFSEEFLERNEKFQQN